MIERWFAASTLALIISILGCVGEPGNDEEAELMLVEGFSQGAASLNWAPYPYFPGDNLKAVEDPDSPEGDVWVGRVANEIEGGFAALSYVRDASMEEFILTTWIHTVAVETENGPLNGIAFGINPVAGNFYRLVADLTPKGNLNLAYVGRDTNNYPVYIKTWEPHEIPGGLPRKSGWHQLSLILKNSQLRVTWDGDELPGGPFPIDKGSGYVGVYANYVGGLGNAETRVDGFKLSYLPLGS